MSHEIDSRSTDAQIRHPQGQAQIAEITFWHDLAQEAHKQPGYPTDDRVTMPARKAPVSVELVAAAANVAQDTRIYAGFDEQMSRGNQDVITPEERKQTVDAASACGRIDETLKGMTAEEQATVLNLADTMLKEEKLEFVYKGNGDLELVRVLDSQAKAVNN